MQPRIGRPRTAILLVVVPLMLTLSGKTISHAQDCGDSVLASVVLTTDLDCPTGHGLILAEDGVTLDCDGHTITGDHQAERYGIYVRDASEVSVRNCVIERFEMGVRLRGADNVVLQFNVARDNTRYGIELTQSSRNNLVAENELLDNRDEGIHVSGPSDSDAWNAILGNLIAGNASEGVYLLGSHRNIVADNDLRNQGKAGIYVKGSDQNVIDQNALSGNPIQLVDGSSLNTVRGNIVTGASVGILIEGVRNRVSENMVAGAAFSGVTLNGANNTLECNWISNNPIGIYVDSGATPNAITMNLIVGNTIGLDATSLPPNPPTIELADNWWGCMLGPTSPECDSAIGNVDISRPATAEPPDSDGDRASDVCDTCTDTDEDGAADPGFTASTCPIDNCPDRFNPNQHDADSDGIGDACDRCTDADEDGLSDPGLPASVDCLPVDNCPNHFNPDQHDADSDNAGDECDTCTDTDTDGFANPGFPASTCPVDNCFAISNPSQADTDTDRIGDACDTCTDSDGDRIGDPGFTASIDCPPIDNCALHFNPNQDDADSDGIGDACDTCTDSDGDGFANPGFPASACRLDNCPTIGNPEQADLDADGLGDACDTCTDSDGDGFADPGFTPATCPVDNCPHHFNPDQHDADRDRTGDACDTCTDTDADGFANPGFPVSTCLVDNCPTDENPSQADSDADGTGDLCDTCPFDADNDIDGDGICGAVDMCPLDPDNDIDADGACGDVDNCPVDENPSQADADADGFGDGCDTCTDTDADGFANPGFPVSTCLVDNCPADENPSQADSDADGTGDLCDGCPFDADNDMDGDGICGDVDMCPLDPDNDIDADGACGDVDNCPADENPSQADADADGLGDACDGCTDADADGLANPGFAASTCPIDNCPLIPNSDQIDVDENGVGDVCECTALKPGRCIAGGGKKGTDCLVEFNTKGPVRLNRTRTMVRRRLSCTDGDRRCDRDGLVDGTCTFGLTVCLGNADPRLARRCAPAEVTSVEVRRPGATTARSSVDRDNALRLEQALSTSGVEIRRRGEVVTAGSGITPGMNTCSPLVDLVVPAPNGHRKKIVKRKLRVVGYAADGRRDRDVIVLTCAAAPRQE